MEINLIKADKKHIDDCKAALGNSELGRFYFSDEQAAIQAIMEGISKDEILAAVNHEGVCVGFIWFLRYGAFHSFPYLHVIAVKEEYRNLGIGKQLLEYFENVVSEGCSKVFLVVADFNPRARQLYENVGYKEVGVIPNLYRNGITEHLMMKEL